MTTTWSEIERLRQQQAEHLRNGSTMNDEQSRRIAELLSDLAEKGDLDAVIQQHIATIDQLVSSGEMSHCDAFASAVGSIAQAIRDRSIPEAPPSFLGHIGEEAYRWGDEEKLQFLQYLWTYLISNDDKNSFSPITRMAGIKPKGGYDHTAPDWATTHQDAKTGSRYISPRSDDQDSDRTGRKAHFIANALFEYKRPVLSSAVRKAWASRETSTTDNEVNKLGADFGDMIASGELRPENISTWIKQNLCTEEEKTPGSLTPEQIEKLRWVELEGSFQSHYEYHNGRDLLQKPTFGPTKKETHYTHDRTIQCHFRGAYISERNAIQFGHALSGCSWKSTHKEELVEDEKTTSTSESFSNNFTVVSGTMYVGPEISSEYSGLYSIDFGGFIIDPAEQARKIGNYSDYWGFPKGKSSDDRTLTGSDKSEEGQNEWVDSKTFAGYGEMLRGTPSVPIKVLNYKQSNWKWTIQIAPTTPPDHVQIFAKLDLKLEEYLLQFREKLPHTLSKVWDILSDSDNDDLSQREQQIWDEMYNIRRSIEDLASKIISFNNQLRDLWISNDINSDTLYKEKLSEFKGIVDEWNKKEKSISEFLVKKVDEMAKITAKGGRGAEQTTMKLGTLSNVLRNQGVKAVINRM